MNRDFFLDNPFGVHHSGATGPRSPRVRAAVKGVGGDRIRLATIGRTLTVLEATTDPCLSHLMAEDTCWRFSHEQWVRARPSRWNREQWHRWQDDGYRLQDKLRRIEQLARGLGLPPEPTPRLRRCRRILGSLGRLFRC